MTDDGMQETTAVHGFALAVRAERVDLREAAAGFVMAGGDVSIQEGGCGPMAVRGDVSIRQGGCGPIAAGGDVEIREGGCGPILAAGGVTVGADGFAVAAIGPAVRVQDGARVMITTPQALAFGAAFGVIAAVAARLLRK